MLKVHKVINNNVVSILDKNKNEVILMGRGIAFQKKPGDSIDESKIAKKFYLEDNSINDKFKQLLKDIPIKHIELASDIVDLAKATINKKFNDFIYVSLSDHIYTAIQRFLGGYSINNPMLWEVKRFYGSEFEIGLKALEMIEEKFKIKLPEDEAGSIAIHIVDAEMEQNNINNVYEMTKVIQDICNIVKYYFGITFDESSVYFYRFITHIRFFAQRIILKTTYDGNAEDGLFNLLKEKYKNAYYCVLKIEEYTNKNYSYQISNDEKLYLMIHIERIVNKSNK